MNHLAVTLVVLLAPMNAVSPEANRERLTSGIVEVRSNLASYRENQAPRQRQTNWRIIFSKEGLRSDQLATGDAEPAMIESVSRAENEVRIFRHAKLPDGTKLITSIRPVDDAASKIY